MKIFVVIATYNEKESIVKLLTKIVALPQPPAAIIVVDDHSPDGTADIIRGLSLPTVQLIVRDQERGYGSAHVRGFRQALDQGAEVIISMDADFSHEPEIIPVMIGQIAAGFDVVVGSRRVAGGRIIGWGLGRKLASKTAMILARLILGLQTKDVTTGFRAYRATKLRQLDLATMTSNGYSFLEEMIFRCEQRHFKIKEIPIVFVDRQEGKSKFSILEIVRFFITLFKLRLNLK